MIGFFNLVQYFCYLFVTNVEKYNTFLYMILAIDTYPVERK